MDLFALPRVTCDPRSDVLSDPDLKAATASVDNFGHSMICLQHSSAIPIGAVVAVESQHVLVIRDQCEALVVLLQLARFVLIREYSWPFTAGSAACRSSAACSRGPACWGSAARRLRDPPAELWPHVPEHLHAGTRQPVNLAIRLQISSCIGRHGATTPSKTE